MRNLFFLLLLFGTFYSCTKQNKILELPVEKFYIVEWNWLIPEEGSATFQVIGFSEINKNYDLRFASRYSDYDDNYFKVEDSLKNIISDIIMKYPSDTAFLYKGGARIYDGNSYIFIVQKKDGVKTRIDFEPEYLPEDLSFLYKCLYVDRQKYDWKSNYGNLFEMFKDTIMSMSSSPYAPPPEIKKTIQFIPPNVVKKTHK